MRWKVWDKIRIKQCFHTCNKLYMLQASIAVRCRMPGAARGGELLEGEDGSASIQLMSSLGCTEPASLGGRFTMEDADAS